MNEQQNLLTPNFNQAPVLPNATAALVLGIISIVGAFCYGIGIILGIIGLVLANKDKKLIDANPDTFSQSSVNNLRAGRICSIIGIVVGAIFLIVIAIYLIYFMPMIMDQVKKGGKY